ncbi:MAG: hypothetical protein AB1798_14575, partial [Spirochaetota bacterium]
IPVLLPEDIIGLKVQSLANNKDRLELELADITLLIKQFPGTLDWDRMAEYFSLFHKDDIFENLKKRYEPKRK